MFFIFSIAVLIGHLWQLNTAVCSRCLMHVDVLLIHLDTVTVCFAVLIGEF